MRRLFLIICTILPALAFAQPGPLDFNLGLKAGMNFTRISGTTWSGGYRSGVLGGAFASLGVKKIGAQIEGLVSTTSFNGNGKNFYNTTPSLLNRPADTTTTGEFSAAYLHVPILLNLKLFGNATIQLGPQFSTALNIKDKDNFLNQPTSGIFNTSDFAGVVGLQLKLPLKLNAGVRYTFGLSDQNLSSVGESWRLSNIQLHIGFSFL